MRAKVRQRPTIEVSSAATGEGIDRILPAALRLYGRSVAAHLHQAPQHRAAKPRRGAARDRARARKQLSLRYIVQTGVNPPTFRLDVNDKALLTRDYIFWIENRLRRAFDLDGLPADHRGSRAPANLTKSLPGR